MAETLENHSEEEKTFWKKRQWTSFKAQMLSALSGATFIGVLTMLVQTAVKEFGTTAVAAAGSVSLSNPITLGIMGAALLVGATFTYLAQNEWTNLKVLEDDHLARRNAEERERVKAISEQKAVSQAQYPQNQRSDGKEWSSVIQPAGVSEGVRLH